MGDRSTRDVTANVRKAQLEQAIEAGMVRKLLRELAMFILTVV
jgi:hypothetical protein